MSPASYVALTRPFSSDPPARLVAIRRPFSVAQAAFVNPFQWLAAHLKLEPSKEGK
jgi:hypothetical protein